MLQREQASGKIEDPCWRGLVSQGGLPFWVNTATGQFAVDPPPDLYDCKGGLFCDEPVWGMLLVLAHDASPTHTKKTISKQSRPLSRFTRKVMHALINTP